MGASVARIFRLVLRVTVVFGSFSVIFLCCLLCCCICFHVLVVVFVVFCG